MYIYLSICLSIYLSIYLYISLYVSMYLSLSLSLHIYNTYLYVSNSSSISAAPGRASAAPLLCNPISYRIVYHILYYIILCYISILYYTLFVYPPTPPPLVPRRRRGSSVGEPPRRPRQLSRAVFVHVCSAFVPGSPEFSANVANLKPCTRLKSCCVHTFAPVQGLRVRASNRVPRLKSCCVHILAPVQGLVVRASKLIPLRIHQKRRHD